MMKPKETLRCSPLKCLQSRARLNIAELTKAQGTWDQYRPVIHSAFFLYDKNYRSLTSYLAERVKVERQQLELASE